MTSLPSHSAGASCLPEKKITLRFARFGAVCMHCVQPSNSGGPSTTVAEPQTSVEKARQRKPVTSKPKGGHRRCFSATSQGMLSSKGCAVLSAFDALTLSDANDDSEIASRTRKYRRLVSTEMPPTPVLGPTIRQEPDIPAFRDLDCDTMTPSSESITPPPLDL